MVLLSFPSERELTTDCTDCTDGAIFVIPVILEIRGPTAVIRFDSHEIAGFDQFCLAPPVLAPKNLRCALDGVRISDFSKTTSLGNWSACPMPLGFDDGTAADATLSGLGVCLGSHTQGSARRATLG